MYVIPFKNRIAQFFYPIQSGSVSITAGNTSNTAAITAINLSKSVLFFSYSCDGAALSPADHFVRGKINSTTQLTFTRSGNVSNITIRYYIVEARPRYAGFKVQRGSSTGTGTSDNISIAAISLNNSVPIISCSMPGAVLGNNDFIEAELTSSTNLQLRSNGANTSNVEWQVIECKDWIVQKIKKTLAALNDDNTISAINLLRSFIVCSATYDSNLSDGNDIPIYYYLNSSTVRIERLAANGFWTITAYAIHCQRGIGAQGYNASILTGSNNQVQSLTSIPSGRGCTHINSILDSLSRYNFSTNFNANVCFTRSFYAAINSNTTYRSYGGATSANTDFSNFALEVK